MEIVRRQTSDWEVKKECQLPVREFRESFMDFRENSNNAEKRSRIEGLREAEAESGCIMDRREKLGFVE